MYEPCSYIHLPALHKGESKSYFRSNLGSLKTSQSQWNLLASFLRLTSTATLLKSVILVKSLKGMSRGFQWLQRTLVKLAVLISIQGLEFGEEEGGGKGDAKSMHNYQWQKVQVKLVSFQNSSWPPHILLTWVNYSSSTSYAQLLACFLQLF